MQIKLLYIVLIWVFILQLILFLGIQVIPLQYNFLGGGMSNYLNNPYPFAWINYDGEHYISIAQKGYEPLKFFFFPGYPLLVSTINNLIGGDFIVMAYSGLIISYIAFFFGILGILKLVDIDFKELSKFQLILLMLLFPTSYFFASFYTESLFLATSVWSFYFARKRKWLISGVFGFFAALTRITGLALLPVMIIEWFVSKEKLSLHSVLGIILIPLGLISYMTFLYLNYGDPLLFTKSLGEVFGEQRAGNFISFFQVFYRYIFKILPNMDFSYWPSVYTIMLEFVSACLFLLVLPFIFVKKKFSYFTYTLSIFVLSTLSGSFSSLPRYILVVFPVFIMCSLLISRLNKIVRCGIYTILLVLLSISLILFTRGYWIS